MSQTLHLSGGILSHGHPPADRDLYPGPVRALPLGRSARVDSRLYLAGTTPTCPRPLGDWSSSSGHSKCEFATDLRWEKPRILEGTGYWSLCHYSLYIGLWVQRCEWIVHDCARSSIRLTLHFEYHDSLLFLGPTGLLFSRTTGGDVSRLFAVDGAFEWYVGGWGDCNGTCSGNDFIFRHRQVGKDCHSHIVVGNTPIAGWFIMFIMENP